VRVTGPLTSVIGVDSGKSVGLGFLDYDGPVIVGVTVLQVEHASAAIVLDAMIARYYADAERVKYRFAGVESFVTGQGAGTKGKDAELTRNIVFELSQVLQTWGYHVEQRPAVTVKAWADNKKLEAIGVLGKNGRCSVSDLDHGCDATRHALYAATHDAYKPNPLR
jgi:hypothetical protein